MCIIILKPSGTAKLDAGVFDRCWKKNPDGFGIMRQNKKGKKTIVSFYKTLDREKALAQFLSVQEDPKNLDIAFHFRITTHGGTTLDNCHPFQAGEDMLMMHN